jgi:hypothetical protein
MDNFTTLANKILTEQRDIRADQIEKLLKKGFEESPFYNKEDEPESPFDRPDAREYSDQMEALTDDIFDAIQKKDKQAHLAVLRKYNAIRDKAIQKFGIDGPVNLIDPDLAGMYSDDFKDENGFRPRSDFLTRFRDAVEFYKDGRYGRIEGDKFIPVEPKSYIEETEIEDQESGIRSLDGFFSDEEAYVEDDEGLKTLGLTDDDISAVNVAQKLATKAGGAGAAFLTQNRMNAAYGDLMRKVAKKVTNVAKAIK